jgi:hypothetical protein
MLEWALRYAAMGWPVFRLQGKKPVKDTHGFKDATTDPDQIRDWWRVNYNIGIHCSQFWVLDVDPAKGGFTSLQSFPEKLDTLTQITGSGGRHYLFQNPGFHVSNSSESIAPGVDVRGSDGYIVACPSIHPDTRKPYEWYGTKDPTPQDIKPAPQWLLDKLTKPAPPAPITISEKISKGQRHKTLTSLAGTMRRRGCTPEEILAAIRVTNSTRCDPPYNDKHLQQIANSMEKYAPALSPAETPVEVSTLPDWTKMLQRNDKGKPIPNVVNASLPLNFDPAFADAIRFNLLRSSIEISRNIPEMLVYNAPCEWADKHDIAYAAWCQTKGIQIAPTTAAHAAILISNLRSFHPVQEYLNSLVWDGVPRITTWLNAYCGVEDNLYTQTVGRKWLISAVNRALHPGCKVDSCLILEGKQNIGKSRALNILGGDWYTDQIKDLDSNDAALQASRVWIVEIGELDAFRKSETTAFKAFLSRQIDQFRPAYGRHVQTFPRQCVFAGTTNQDQYLHDETGNRRFWPVRCHQILQDALATDRDQLWAEAVVAANSGEPCWIEDADVITAATGEANIRFIDDAWAEKLIPWMVDRFAMGDRFVTTSQLLESCLDMRTKDWTQRDQDRVAKILRQLHFARRKFRSGQSVVWGWHPTSDSTSPFD